MDAILIINFVCLQVSALELDIIEVDPETKEMLKALVGTINLSVKPVECMYERLEDLTAHPPFPVPPISSAHSHHATISTVMLIRTV